MFPNLDFDKEPTNLFDVRFVHDKRKIDFLKDEVNIISDQDYRYYLHVVCNFNGSSHIRKALISYINKLYLTEKVKFDKNNVDLFTHSNI